MIQRIQSIYFALNILILGYFFTGITLVKFENKVNKTVEYRSVFGRNLFSIAEGKETLVKAQHQPLYVAIALLILLLFIALMRYKNPRKQLGIARLAMMINALFLVAFVIWTTYLFSSAPKESNNSVGLGYYLLCTTLPLSYFAYRGVLRDKMLLDSLDRLR